MNYPEKIGFLAQISLADRVFLYFYKFYFLDISKDILYNKNNIYYGIWIMFKIK